MIVDGDYIANLSFLLDYDEGIAKDEIEYEILKIALQKKGSIHYDRVTGGDFENLEQESFNDGNILSLRFAASMVESIYRLNEEKGFTPYIVIGFSDIVTEIDAVKGKYVSELNYRLLKDIVQSGSVKVEI